MANEVARALRRRMTPQEVRVWVHVRALRPQGLYFRRQVPLEPYVVDFACLRAKLIVEIDCAQHGMPDGLKRDMLRDKVLAGKGFRVMRFWNIDVDRSVIAVIDTVIHEATIRLRDPR